MQHTLLTKRFSVEEAIHKSELVSLLRGQYPDAKPSTLDWRISDLVQRGLLARSGRGRYRIVANDTRSATFTPEVPDELGHWAAKLAEAFPLLTPCLWSTQAVWPYLLHVSAVEYWLLEVDRDAVDSVLSFVQSVYSREDSQIDTPVIRADDLATMESYLTDVERILLIKPLISEAPLQQADGVSTITAEKLLVDLIADDGLFFMYREELPRIAGGIAARYVINTDKARRYARRRNRLPELNDLLTRANARLTE